MYLQSSLPSQPQHTSRYVKSFVLCIRSPIDSLATLPYWALTASRDPKRNRFRSDSPRPITANLLHVHQQVNLLIPEAAPASELAVFHSLSPMLVHGSHRIVSHFRRRPSIGSARRQYLSNLIEGGDNDRPVHSPGPQASVYLWSIPSTRFFLNDPRYLTGLSLLLEPTHFRHE